MTSDPGNVDPVDEQPTTVLPLRRHIPNENSGRSRLRVVLDADQVSDHSGKPVEPVTATGLPYRYKVRLTGANAYALTADEILALFIDDYNPDPPAGFEGRDEQLEQVRRRGLHCIGVIVDHVAAAMLDRKLTAEEELLLQRSADLGDGKEPITRHDCPIWTNDTVPMLLMGDLYAAEYGKYDPPAGNVIFLRPGRAERYLRDLARLGLVALSENPAYTARPPVTVRAT